MAAMATKIHVDSTYKIVYQGYPLIVIGATDEDRHFHLIGFQLSDSEAQLEFEFLFNSVLKGIKDLDLKIDIEAVVSIS